MNQLRPFEMLTMEMSEKRISNGVIFSQYSTQNVATQKVACFFFKKKSCGNSQWKKNNKIELASSFHDIVIDVVLVSLL